MGLELHQIFLSAPSLDGAEKRQTKKIFRNKYFNLKPIINHLYRHHKVLVLLSLKIIIIYAMF